MFSSSTRQNPRLSLSWGAPAATCGIVDDPVEFLTAVCTGWQWSAGRFLRRQLPGWPDGWWEAEPHWSHPPTADPDSSGTEGSWRENISWSSKCWAGYLLTEISRPDKLIVLPSAISYGPKSNFGGTVHPAHSEPYCTPFLFLPFSLSFLPKPVFNQHECPPTSMWTLCSANSYILNIFLKCVTLNKGYNSHADYTIVSHPFGLLVFFLQWRRRPTDLVKFQASPGETIWDKHWSANNIFHLFQVFKLHRLCPKNYVLPPCGN